LMIEDIFNGETETKVILVELGETSP